MKWVSGPSIAEGRAQGSVDLGQLDLRHVRHASLLSVWMATEHNMAQGVCVLHMQAHDRQRAAAELNKDTERLRETEGIFLLLFTLENATNTYC